MNHSLLPSGFFDLLPPDARQQRLLMQQMMECFAGYGYQEVNPPLMEFETSLASAQTFRMMDPFSRKMMGIRSDMTMQVARIASSRLADQPKPLRLSYGGICLRVAGEGIRRERQFMQAGVELIGSAEPAADVEIIRMAVEALQPLGLGEITVDCNLPRLASTLLESLPEAWHAPCRAAIAQKDRASLAQFTHPLIPALQSLLEISGSVDITTLPLPQGLPKTAQTMLESWKQRLSILQQAGIPARLTFDPLEQQGFDYHHELAFSIFASRVESEIGRGGRYVMEDGTPAIGFTFYLNPMRHVMKLRDDRRKCFVPLGAAPEISQRLRLEGWVILHGLEATTPPTQQATQLGCTHWLRGEEAVAVA